MLLSCSIGIGNWIGNDLSTGKFARQFDLGKSESW